MKFKFEGKDYTLEESDQFRHGMKFRLWNGDNYLFFKTQRKAIKHLIKKIYKETTYHLDLEARQFIMEVE